MTDIPHRLEIEDASLSYGDEVVLQQLNFQVPQGARVAVVGPNGAGKSTMFKALVGLLPLRSGRILIHGLALGYHKDCVAYIPQREEVDWRFPVTVADVVMMGRFGRLGWLRTDARQDRLAVRHALEQMDIGVLADRSIGDLSGGQQQRVFLARALAQEPHILLMDEPFNGVDMITQDATLRLLDDLRARDVTVMIATHDLNLAASRFDYILLLNRRQIAFGKPQEVMSKEHLQHAFGSALLVTADGTMLVDECCAPEEPVKIDD